MPRPLLVHPPSSSCGDPSEPDCWLAPPRLTALRASALKDAAASFSWAVGDDVAEEAAEEAADEAMEEAIEGTDAEGMPPLRHRFNGDSPAALPSADSKPRSPEVLPGVLVAEPVSPWDGTERTAGGNLALRMAFGRTGGGGGIMAGDEVALLAGENSVAVGSSLEPLARLARLLLPTPPAACCPMRKRAWSERWSDGNWDAGREPSRRTVSSLGNLSIWVGVRPGLQKM